MNENKDIKKVYEQIHAPEALLGKVMEMKKDEFKGRMMVKYIAAAVLVYTIAFVFHELDMYKIKIISYIPEGRTENCI